MGDGVQRKRRCLFFTEVSNVCQKDGLIWMTATVNGKEHACAFTPELRAFVLDMEGRKLAPNVLKMVPRQQH